MEDHKLIEAISDAKAGNEKGFDALMKEYATRLYGYFYRSTMNHHDSEDLLGELALKLVKVISKYDERGRFEPWLFRIAANLVRDRIRKSKARPVVLSFSNPSDHKSQSGFEPIDNDTAEGGVIKAERNLALHKALGELDEKTREMVLLRFFGQLSFKELSQQFDMPIGTVLARVHRGLGSLKKILADEADNNE